MYKNFLEPHEILKRSFKDSLREGGMNLYDVHGIDPLITGTILPDLQACRASENMISIKP